MSLSKEALDAIAAFRKNVSENPSDYVDEESTLKSKLISLVERNSSESEGKYLEKIFDSYLNYNFSHFNFSSPNRDKKFDKEEYLLAEFLYAPTFKLQKTLVSEWRDHLKDLTEEEFKKNEDLKNSYEKVNRFSKDWFSLKQKSLLEKIDRKTIYTINFFQKEQSENNNDWIFPSVFKRNLGKEFQKSSLSFLKSWGYSDENADLYIKIVEEAIKDKKIITYAAIAGGTILAAYGLRRTTENLNQDYLKDSTQYSREIANYSRDVIGTFKTKPMTIDYGVLSQPEFLTMPHGQIHANQLGFQSYLQGMNNANNLVLQSLKNTGEILNPQNISGQLNQGIVGGNQGIVGGNQGIIGGNQGIVGGNQGNSGLETEISAVLGSALNQTGKMLGSSATLSVNQFANNRASITGLVGGKPFSKHITKIGNAINIR